MPTTAPRTAGREALKTTLGLKELIPRYCVRWIYEERFAMPRALGGRWCGHRFGHQESFGRFSSGGSFHQPPSHITAICEKAV